MNLSGISGQKILYGCLDWGNGHVFRSIPIIRRLLQQRNEILLFCSVRQQAVFQHYLQDSVHYYIGFDQDFHFSGSGNFVREMWQNRSHFAGNRKQEMKLVGELSRTNSIDLIISDHRYGMASDQVKSVFLTHQLQLPTGVFSNWFHKRFMRNFTEILLMDNSTDPLAGKLSKGGNPEQYIGWFSRFENQPVTTDSDSIVAVLSGPDIYAEQLMQKIGELKKRYPGNWSVISTHPALQKTSMKVISNLSEADELIASAGRIVSRSGYTTLMDLEYLQKPAILIPTKGQVEQEYLADLQETRSDRIVLRI